MSEFGCPQHPQSHWYWRTIDDADFMACSICCTLLKPKERETMAQKAPEPVIIRSFAMYSDQASRTDTGNHPLAYYAGCLCEEAGEIWGILKKAIWHGHEWNRDKIKRELGDALWYLDRLTRHLGFTLEEVASGNIQHLRKEYPNGFSEEASRNRKRET